MHMRNVAIERVPVLWKRQQGVVNRSQRVHQASLTHNARVVAAAGQSAQSAGYADKEELVRRYRLQPLHGWVVAKVVVHVVRQVRHPRG